MKLKEKIADLRKHLQSSGKENEKAFSSGFIFVSLLIIGVIALFLDIIFVTMIWNALPGGFLRIFAAGGAILVSPVIILILLAKLYYFRSGGQLIFSYIAFAVDIAFAALNTYCAFQIAWGNTSDAFVASWRSLSPITPCVILLLLAILILLDPNAKRHNQEREYGEKERDLELRAQYEDKERQFALRQLDLELQAAQQEAAIEVKTTALEEYKSFLKEEILSSDALAELREGARRLRDETIHAVTGLSRPITHQPPALPQPPVQQLPQSNIMSSQPSVSTPVQPVAQASAIDYDRLAHAVIRATGVLPAQQQQPQNPLQSPQLDTANQPGMNGTSNGHQKSQA